jgi:aspartyl-tRNA(Asn)/glutamyl-tRNA(Gln) amidotransferase subunit A
MSDPISMTLAEARDALKAKKISSTELTTALVRSVEQSRGLNAFVTETPDRAMAMAAGKRRGRRAGRPAAGDQGSVLHQGREDHGGQPDPGQFRAAL